MKYRVLGKTGWKVSVLGFGAAPLGKTHGDFSEKDGVRAVHTAIDLGINFIDVGPYYGLTMAESVVGKALTEIPREKYYLATKVGRYGADEKDFDFSAQRVVRSVDESLKRLRVAHVDLIQCQDVEFANVASLIEDTIPALLKLKRQGKVFIRVFPDKPISKKPLETRMGTGKADVEYWAARVKAGTVLFEIAGVPENLAKQAFNRVAMKMPIRCRFVGRRLEV